MVGEKLKEIILFFLLVVVINEEEQKVIGILFFFFSFFSIHFVNNKIDLFDTLTYMT